MSEQKSRPALYWQRIAGGLVLAGMLLLLLPVFVSDVPEEPQQPAEQPTIEPLAIELDSTSANDAAVEVAEAVQQVGQQQGTIPVDDATRKRLLNQQEDVQESAAEPDNPKEAQLADDKGLTAYSVRLGVFANAENISKLTAKLTRHKIKSYTRMFERNGKLMHIVLAGPYATYDMARTTQSTIRRQLPEIADSQVVEYRP